MRLLVALSVLLMSGCAVTPPPTTPEASIVEAVPVAPVEPEPPPRFLDCMIAWKVRYIRDTYTGREYLCNTEGGIIEILPKGAAK